MKLYLYLILNEYAEHLWEEVITNKSSLTLYSEFDFHIFLGTAKVTRTRGNKVFASKKRFTRCQVRITALDELYTIEIEKHVQDLQSQPILQDIYSFTKSGGDGVKWVTSGKMGHPLNPTLVLVFALYFINKAGFTAPEVACGWAGAIFEVTRPFGQEQ